MVSYFNWIFIDALANCCIDWNLYCFIRGIRFNLYIIHNYF